MLCEWSLRIAITGGLVCFAACSADDVRAHTEDDGESSEDDGESADVDREHDALRQCFEPPDREGFYDTLVCPCDTVSDPRFCLEVGDVWECRPLEVNPWGDFESRWGTWWREPADPPFFPVTGTEPDCSELYARTSTPAEISHAHTDCCPAFADWGEYRERLGTGSYDPRSCPCEAAGDIYPFAPGLFCRDDQWLLYCLRPEGVWAPVGEIGVMSAE